MFDCIIFEELLSFLTSKYFIK